jgi:glutamate synthase (NADPH/NADH) large chain
MSKMGISTYQSYCGAPDLRRDRSASDFVDRYFFGTATLIEGVGLKEIAEETVAAHRGLRQRSGAAQHARYRRRIPTACAAKRHAWTPDAVANLQHAVRSVPGIATRTIRQMVNSESARADDHSRPVQDQARGNRLAPVPLDDVEPAADIVKRFSTGAMSFGSISREAHTTLAIAMNQIGGKSNTGEGGEEADRYLPLPDGEPGALGDQADRLGTLRRDDGISRQFRHDADQGRAGRQARRGRPVARPQGRCDDRQDPAFDAGRRADLAAAASRHLFDRRSGAADLRSEERQPAADVSVKLVSEVGVGTVAAGVAKARADHITISGFDGGTGASPLTSLKHAGSPWEIGLAETQQTLVLNGLARASRCRSMAAAHRARRHHRRAARRRRVRLLDGTADRRRLHHDAQVPPQHLSGRRRDAGPGAAQALQGHARACHQLLLLRRGRGARTAGRDGLHHIDQIIGESDLLEKRG